MRLPAFAIASLLSSFILIASGCGSQDISTGQHGADCVTDNQCLPGLACIAGSCRPTAGEDVTLGDVGEACYANNTCNPGGQCEGGTCVACEAGTEGCACFGNATCMDGLTCAGGVCQASTEAGGERLPPANPRCYSPCKESFVRDDGTPVICDAEGLFEGCWSGTTCVQGSCVATQPFSSPTSVVGGDCSDDDQCGESEACVDGACACTSDLACPDFQTCIQGRCYSQCNNDAECLSGEVCDRHVCRVQCDSANPCPKNEQFCDVPGNSQVGVCKLSMAQVAEGSGTARVPDFYLNRPTINFGNTHLEDTFVIVNDDILPHTFTLTKVSGSTALTGRPLHWVDWGCTDGCAPDESGVAETDSFSIVIGASSAAEITINDTAWADLPNWTGRVSVVSDAGGERTLVFDYVEQPEGRWEGNMFYFANFPDRCLYAESFEGGGGCNGWIDNKDDPTELASLDNAFVRKWNDFVKGDMSLDEFKALVQSTLTQSWRSTLMQEYCPNSNTACYPNDNDNGFSVYSSALDTYEIPSGSFELPVAMNLRPDPADGAHLVGRIESSSSMQYAGNPSISLQLESEPADCTANSRGVTLCRVTDLEAQVLVGGRSSVDEDVLPESLAFIADGLRPPCSDYVAGADSNYALYYEPWLIPGFELGTKYDATSGLRYQFECRDKRLPLYMEGENPTEDETAINLSLASANAIPDGRTRVRNIRIIDGVLVNQRALVILFQEEFDSFLGDTDGTFSAYGLMELERNPMQLDDDAYEGNDPIMTPVEGEVIGPVCSAAMLQEITDATGLTFPDLETNATQAGELAELMIFGQTAPGGSEIHNPADSSSPAAPGDANTAFEHVHWWCSQTDLIDGGLDGDIPCPGAAQARFFSITSTANTLAPDELMDLACNQVTDISVSISDDVVLKQCKEGEEGCNCTVDPGSCRTCSSFDDGTATRPCQIVRTDTQTDFYTVNNPDFIPGNCLATIEGWAQDDLVGNADGIAVSWDPSYRCQTLPDGSQPTFCSFALDAAGRPIADERVAKRFYASGSGTAAFPSLSGEIVDAFRYKTQFRSRSGKNIGFAPEICASGSDQIPYCYDPPAIEMIQQRVDCLAHLYDTHWEQTAWETPQPDLGNATTKEVVRSFLEQNFSAEIITVNPANGAVLAAPVVNDGFERLYSELLIMMGDESFTKAFASRFDLAGSNILSFQGTLFEPGGFDLSGGAGYEMYVLYQARQYYDRALDRFYRLAPFIWRSVSEFGDTDADGFIGAETVTTYLERLIRASTQKARTNSEIAQRYADFNEPALARRVIERGYTAAYLESVVLSRMMLRMLDEDVVGTSGPQILKTVEQAQLTYRSALLRMANVYSGITDNPNYFGYALDYIPFPTLDVPFGAGGAVDTNAFEVLRDLVRDQIDVAGEKEDDALAQSRSYETDAAAFQAELVNIRTNYENQLVAICGTFTGTDGQVYPAIQKYAHLSTSPDTDPCGKNNGQISDTLTELSLAVLDHQSAQQALIDHEVKLKIIKEDVIAQCELIDNIATYKFEFQDEINDHLDVVNRMQGVLNQADRVNDQVYNYLSIASNGNPFAAGAASVAYGASVIAYNLITTAGEIAISEHEQAARDKENALGRWETQTQCDFALLEANRETKELILEAHHLGIAHQQQLLTVASTIGTLEGLYREARRIQAEQDETEQLVINIEAARNDPNVRIYKNDAILTADRTFERALTSAYRLTKIYEYYTSSSYAFFGDLFLIRLVKRGDISLEQYIDELEDAFFAFEESYGLPDARVMTISLRDDIFAIPRITPDGQQTLTEVDRARLFQEALFDPSRMNEDLHIAVPFAIRLDQLSPVTNNHKIYGVEAEVLGSDGDDVFRVYLRQRGTGVVRALDGDKLYYGFPKRTAVINASLNGERPFDDTIYTNLKLRDRPLANTHYELLINLHDEPDNLDLDRSSVSDVRLVVYYTDFSEL